MSLKDESFNMSQWKRKVDTIVLWSDVVKAKKKFLDKMCNDDLFIRQDKVRDEIEEIFG